MIKKIEENKKPIRTTIAINEEVINYLDKNGKYKDTPNDIILRAFKENEQFKQSKQLYKPIPIIQEMPKQREKTDSKTPRKHKGKPKKGHNMDPNPEDLEREN